MDEGRKSRINRVHVRGASVAFVDIEHIHIHQGNSKSKLISYSSIDIGIFLALQKKGEVVVSQRVFYSLRKTELYGVDYQ